MLVTDTLDASAIDRLKAGGKVLLTAAGKVTLGDDVVQHYLPVFWNTSWFKMRPPHTTGATIDTSHPIFKHNFPTDDWSNLNWWEPPQPRSGDELRESSRRLSESCPAHRHMAYQPQAWHDSGG